jgi:hypothetical protein
VLLPLLALSPGTPGAGAATHVTEMGATGMHLDQAFSTYTTGDPDVLIAYVEGGINWNGNDAATLAQVAYVNWHVTPVPCRGATVATATMKVTGTTEACHTVYSPVEANYDLDASGVINVTQWKTDPRVHTDGGHAFLDPEDLIAAFCTATYHPPLDAAGLPCDISGWDFYDNQDDPATIDAAYDHANDQMATIHSMCPKCTIMPVKAGDEALDPTDNLAKAWLFAAEEGARVIVSVTADLGFSPYMRQVVDKLEKMGVAMVEASNDFDSTDHQGGMFWPYVIPGNGAVASAAGTAWVRSDETSWGAHNILTAATGGGSTSESTPTLGGVLGLLLSYGDEAYAQAKIPDPLTGPEAEQLLEQTATPFTDAALGWPGTPITPGAPDDWNQQYGYGMPNAYAAMEKVAAGEIPAEAAIDSPDWYSTFDPTTTSSVTVTGHIDAATPTTAFTWKLEAATGVQPANPAFTAHVIGSGTGTGSFTGTLGTLDLATVPATLWKAPYAISPTKTLSTSDQYTVTFRLVVNETAADIDSEDRRAVDVVHDPTLLPGFPEAVDPGSAGTGSAGPTGGMGRASAESEPQLVDLQGSGHLDLVFGDSEGLVHAIDPATGDELPGWPVRVQPVPDDTLAHTGITPGGQPIIANVAVGDLFHTGQLDVVVETVDGTVDAYDAAGGLLAGWPKVMTTGVAPPAIPRPAEPNVRLPNREAASAPVLAALTAGSDQLDIVAAGGDGYLHAWTPAGNPLPGWPVKVAMPAGFSLNAGYELEADQRLEATPTVAWLDGHSGPPDIVERSQYTEITSSGVSDLPYSFVFAYSPAGRLLDKWPVKVAGFAEFYGSAQEEITEGSSSAVAADVNGSGSDVIADSPVWTTPSEIDGTGTVLGPYGNAGKALETLLKTSEYTTTQCTADSTPQTPIAFTSSGAYGELGGKLVYAQSEIGAGSLGCLEHPNAEVPITTYESAFPADAASGGAGSELAGYPGPRQGDGFLTSPIITGVTAAGTSVVEGGDTSAITAVKPTGAEAPGFPKFTSGWDLWAPAAGDLLSTGRTDIVTTTREGYVYAWATTGKATTNDQWWSAHHDTWNDGNYGVDSRPPGALRDQGWSAPTATATFVAPGDNWYDGEVARYRVTYGPSGYQTTVAPSGPAGTTEAVAGPPGTTGLRIQAEDAAGNLGPAAVFGVAPPVAPLQVGYTMVAADGGVFTFGGAQFYGSMGGKPLDAPIVGIAATPTGGGYWEVAADGGIFSFGDARFYGSMGGRPLNRPIVGIAATPTGGGYWEVAADGGIFSFGNARFYGSMGGRPLNRPIVGLAADPGGGGYWEVASDGGIFSFGSAAFEGSMGGKPLNRPIVGLAADPGGGGYWEVASDGGIFSFGDGPFLGSTGSLTLNRPVVGVAPTADGGGYREVASDGGVFSFGDAAFDGSAASLTLSAPVVGMAG